MVQQGYRGYRRISQDITGLYRVHQGPTGYNKVLLFGILTNLKRICEFFVFFRKLFAIDVQIHFCQKLGLLLDTNLSSIAADCVSEEMYKSHE